MMITVLGKQFDYQVYDLDAMAKSEASDAALKAALEAVGGYEGQPSIEQQEAMFAAYTAYFDAMLGEGSLSQILGGRRNVMDATEAYYDFRDAVLDAMIQRVNAVARRAAIPEKYSPDRIRA